MKLPIKLDSKYDIGRGRSVIIDANSGLVLFEATEEIADYDIARFVDDLIAIVEDHGYELALHTDGWGPEDYDES